MVTEILLAFAVAFIVVLLCDMSVTKKFREAVGQFNSVLTCDFCTSFWVSLLMVPMFSPEDFVIKIPAIAMAATIIVNKGI